MTKSTKSAPLRSHETDRRSKTVRNLAASGRMNRVNGILAEATIDDRNREILMEAAVQYAPLMKRLADK
jgi:hypothetical protein